MVARSVASGSYAGSAASSKSSNSARARADIDDDEGQDLLHRRSSVEDGIFGVLFTLSKDNSDTHVNIHWVLIKVLVDAWQLFTTVVTPAKQGWHIDAKGTVWAVVGVLNFQWLGSLGYGTYLAVLYSMVALLAVNVGMCVWVAWCFKERKFPVVWPIQVLRVFSSVFFQAFDVTSLSILQLGISCRYTGYTKPRLHMDLFPEYSCSSGPHLFHAAVSAVSLIAFVAIALLLNMAEVEVNPKSRRPLALGHSGSEVAVFAIKVLLTLVDVFLGWRKVAACAYLALSLILAYQYIRWNPNLVGWMNYLKSGVAVSIVWAAGMLMLLVFRPGVRGEDEADSWAAGVTVAMLAGLAPAFAAGGAMSWGMIRYKTNSVLKALADAKPDMPLEEVCRGIRSPRDVEIVARCCRVWQAGRVHLEPTAVNRALDVIKAGLAMFPASPYMVLLHANFMIDVLGVSQRGNSRIEDAVKLDPGLMCRFIMFVRQQQATQQAAGKSTSGASMDLLGYVEYQRKQRMVLRLHREALQAMCNFWRALDASNVSFTHLSKALGKIESSITQAQTAYRVVLQSYGNNPKLVRLYGRFLQTVKNDPWAAAEYFKDADRLEETKDSDANGPLLPDGTPLGRMDELATAVLVISAMGEIQMVNRQTHLLFGYKKGTLDGKPMSFLLAPHCARWLSSRLAELVAASSLTAAALGQQQDMQAEKRESALVAMHCDRLAFVVKLTLARASGVGEDSTFIALLEPVPPTKGVSRLWVSHNGTIVACDPQFVSAFGWKPSEVTGATVTALMSVPSFGGATHETGDEEEGGLASPASASDTVARLLVEGTVTDGAGGQQAASAGLQCLVAQKYDSAPAGCTVRVVLEGCSDTPVYELRLKPTSGDRDMLIVANRKGLIVHVSSELAACLKDSAGVFGGRHKLLSGEAQGLGGGVAGLRTVLGGPTAPGLVGGAGAASTIAAGGELLAGYTLSDFLPMPWKEMHPKYFRDTTTLSPPGRGAWSCRKGSPPAPTLELRSTAGKPLYMRVSVITSELGGELTHVVRMTKSSLEAALSERRVRLSVSPEGLITGLASGPPAQALGLEASQVLGRGLWEIVEDLAPGADPSGRPPTPGPRMLGMLVSRATSSPGTSWRVRVVPPPTGRGAMSEVEAATRSSVAKPAVMQVSVEVAPSPSEEALSGPTVYVDLWPASSLSGVLELDGSGRVQAALEERLRPVGLLFGLPAAALLGSAFSDLVALPPGRSSPADLLSLGGAKKSNLKANKKEPGIRVGPVHVLQAAHADGRPLALEVQVVGRPGGANTPVTVILRPHAAPLLLSSLALVAGDPVTVPALLPSPTAEPPLTAISVPHFSSTTRQQSMSRLSIRRRTIASGLANVEVGRTSAGSLPPTLQADISSPQPTASTPTEPPGLYTSFSIRRGLPATEGSQRWSAILAAPISPVTSSVRATDIGIMTTATLTLPTPPDLMASDPTGTLMQFSGVAAAGRAERGSRSKLGDMVRAAVSRQETPSASLLGMHAPPSTASERLRPKGSSRFFSNAVVPEGQRSMGRSPMVQEQAMLPGEPTSVLDPAHLLETASGLADPPIRGTTVHSPEFGVESLDSASDGGDGDSASHGITGTGGAGRVSTWVASEGAFYQNNESPDRGSPGGLLGGNTAVATSHARVDRVASPEAASASPMKQPTVGGYEDDDARSEGGASAMSGQSAATVGSENGRRFKRLSKLMYSSQAQKVQKRLRLHAAATVALIGIIHIVCFVLVLVSVNNLRTSMALLGRNGEAARLMQQILTDVRSLDVISKNKTAPWLYTEADTIEITSRVEQNAEQMKARMNAILEDNHENGSPILDLLFYTKTKVWSGNVNGTDLWGNSTAWEAHARFYAMTMEVLQSLATWRAEGVFVASTDAGQYILKTGPDLYTGFRLVMDALLYNAVDHVHQVDNLQIILLAIEGCVVSCLAAWYLAHLLRAVASQRLALYRTFLMIPVGLTRVLASQDTVLLVEDDEDDDIEEDAADKAAAVHDADDGDGSTLNGGDKPHQRRSVVLTADAAGADDGGGGTDNGFFKPGSRRRSGNGLRTISGDGTTSRRVSERGVSALLSANHQGCWGTLKYWLGRPFSRWTRATSLLPQTSLGGGAGRVASFNANGGRRNLKNDSHETTLMLSPFLLWSALVLTCYVTAVVRLKDMIGVVAIHSVVNRIAARTYQSVFFAQELAMVEDPVQLAPRRTSLGNVLKLARDSWLTLQLGSEAYKAGGDNIERFPLVDHGLTYASPGLTELFYTTGRCLRMQEHLPCPGPDYRYYRMTRAGLDTMMGQFMTTLQSMASNASMVPEGLANDRFNLVYSVGTTDLIDGMLQMRIAHHELITRLLDGILLLHIVLLVLLFVIFAGFVFLLLNPLLRRVILERRRIAELMAQLPLELDVEKLVARALGTAGTGGAGGGGGGGQGGTGGSAALPTAAEGVDSGDQDTRASKWRSILRSASNNASKQQQ